MLTRRRLIRVSAIVLVATGVSVVLYLAREPEPALSGLIAHTLRDGRDGTIPFEAFKNLKLPTDGQYNVPVRAVVVAAAGSDRTKSFAVRGRLGQTDVLLSDTRSNAGKFYHCSPHGQRISASVIGGEKLSAIEVRQAVEAELRFWLHWWEKRAEKP